MTKNNFTYLIFILTVSLTLQAQTTLYTDVFVPDAPGPLEAINDELYIGIIQGDLAVYKLEINNPNNPILVSDFAGNGIGIWKMAYHESTNNLYVISLWTNAIYRIDLNQPTPISPENLGSLPIGGYNGIVFHGDELLLLAENIVYKADINDPTFELTPYYTDPDIDILLLNAVVFEDHLIFSQKYNGDPNFEIYKLPLIANPEKSLVSEASGYSGACQSAVVVANYLYLGLEGPQDLILKIDLAAPIPLQPESIISDFPGGPIGLTENDGLFYASEGNGYTIVNFTDPTLIEDDFASPSFQIYPNPSSERFYLSNVNGTVRYTIHSTNGQKLIENKYSNEIGIIVSQLSNGVYFLGVENSQRTSVLKFIKH